MFTCDKCGNTWTAGHGGGEYAGHGMPQFRAFDGCVKASSVQLGSFSTVTSESAKFLNRGDD